eukprot:3273179-Prymnesium_polylepis.1
MQSAVDSLPTPYASTTSAPMGSGCCPAPLWPTTRGPALMLSWSSSLTHQRSSVSGPRAGPRGLSHAPALLSDPSAGPRHLRRRRPARRSPHPPRPRPSMRPPPRPLPRPPRRPSHHRTYRVAGGAAAWRVVARAAAEQRTVAQERTAEQQRTAALWRTAVW